MKKLMLAVATCVFSASVYAQPPGPEDMEALKAAMDECAAEYSITLPEPGSRERPDRAVMEQMDSCMADKGFEKPKGPPRGGKDDKGPRDVEEE